MNRLRTFFMRHRVMAFVLVMASLCMKVVVPSGFMIAQNSKVLTVQICSDGFGHSLTKQLVIPMKGEPSDSSSKQGKGDCPFSTLSMASVSGADQALLGLALAFILALGFVPVRGALPSPFFYLRPPLRGPPALL
ncbi:hypothetical protein HGI47_14440 [Novosphingobium sp. ERN07]|uniref:DUF2946 family protein n=1 Tax=Novosphingobium sp. ERN07 TaxID=2726187 RepID=UPI001456B583|nr:DUF2946 family protein [Novosphingobium sp. ERN07]NLR72071.1 hypothetical protein [Novosphingobium sp. ERN07]